MYSCSDFGIGGLVQHYDISIANVLEIHSGVFFSTVLMHARCIVYHNIQWGMIVDYKNFCFIIVFLSDFQNEYICIDIGTRLGIIPKIGDNVLSSLLMFKAPNILSKQSNTAQTLFN